MRLFPVGVVVLSTVLSAQAPAFDAASIRENTSGSAAGTAGLRANGQWVGTGVTVRALISLAYNVPLTRVIGGPDWTAAIRYDITAVTSRDAGPRIPQMLLTLLEDRFRFMAHVEKRELPSYNLVLARPDGRLGSGLRRGIDCEDPVARARERVAGSAPCTGLRTTGNTIQAGGIRIQTLINPLTSASGRPVFDKTGLRGGYDVNLRWGTAVNANSPDAVTVFTALETQLGLRLEPSMTPIDVVIIDRIERPTEN